MGTTLLCERLAATLFGKTRRAVLAVLFGHSEQSFYMREIVRLSGAAHGATQRELGRLAEAGIILRTPRGRQVFYQANAACPVFAEIRALIQKTAGIIETLRDALTPLAQDLKLAFVFGSFARGDASGSSDVDLCLVGRVSFAQVVDALTDVQRRHHREVNPTVYSIEEFASKLAAGHHFVGSIAEGPIVCLIGDMDELAGMAKQRLVDPAPDKSG